MRLTPKMQTALLFCLYLSRAGKATHSDAAYMLAADADVLTECLLLLENSQILKAVDIGTYEMIGTPTVGDILKAISPKVLLTSKETNALKLGQHEHRALALFATSLSSALDPFLKRTMPGLNNDLILAELTQLDGAAEVGTGN